MDAFAAFPIIARAALTNATADERLMMIDALGSIARVAGLGDWCVRCEETACAMRAAESLQLKFDALIAASGKEPA